MREQGLVGWYLRVLQPGLVPTAGPIEVVERHPSGVTVLEVHQALQRPAVASTHLLDLEPLATRIRNWLRVPDRGHHRRPAGEGLVSRTPSRA